MTSAENPLELSGEQLRRLVDLAMQHIGPHIDSLAEQPAWNCDDAHTVARSVCQGIPEQGQVAEEIFADLFQRLIPVTYNTASPGYFAYVPGGGLPHCAVADLIANSVNRFVGIWIAAPGLAQIEASVIRWFCDIVGYPKQASGFLTTGGSLANWSALVTVRECRLQENLQRVTIYTSNQSHHSVQRAARLAGIPLANIRQIKVDERFRICVEQLALRIARDRRDGWRPLAIVASAGTTNTGAVDPLNDLADLAAQENLWLHIDAAYGGFFMLTERGRHQMHGIERADSITLDPHKGLFLPYGTGCLLVRQGEQLRKAHSLTADYMPKLQDSDEFVDFCEISPELSRDFRGLRVWLPLKMHGIGAFRDNLDEKLDLARWVTDQLRKLNDEIDDELEIVAEPQLSIVAFRLRRAGLDENELTKLNEDFRNYINASRRVFLTPTTLDGRYVIRICVISFRSHRDRMEECVHEIRRAMTMVR